MTRVATPGRTASGSGKKSGALKSLLNFCAMSRESSRCWRWSSPTGTLVHLALIEQDRAFRVDAACNVRGGHFARRASNLGWIDRLGQRVHVDDAIDARHLVLHPH